MVARMEERVLTASMNSLVSVLKGLLVSTAMFCQTAHWESPVAMGPALLRTMSPLASV